MQNLHQSVQVFRYILDSQVIISYFKILSHINGTIAYDHQNPVMFKPNCYPYEHIRYPLNWHLIITIFTKFTHDILSYAKWYGHNSLSHVKIYKINGMIFSYHAYDQLTGG